MKPRESLLTHGMLTEALDYDPETGIFTWKKVTSNRAKIGAIAGSFDHHGHRLIKIHGVRYSAHRLAWFYAHKVWPEHEIDHINLVKDDNRLCNLREATRQQNVRNVARKSHNKSGFKGVIRHSQCQHRFMAQITVDGKPKYLGMFDTPEEAHAAYVAASLKYHGEWGRID